MFVVDSDEKSESGKNFQITFFLTSRNLKKKTIQEFRVKEVQLWEQAPGDTKAKREKMTGICAIHKGTLFDFQSLVGA